MPLTVYYCATCGERKGLPEKPSDASRTVNIGCPHCERIRRFEKLGVPTTVRLG